MADIKKIEIDGTSYDIVGKGMPAGGAAGKVLKKVSGSDYDTEWADEESAENPLPSGGATGEVLVKASNDDYDAEWAAVHNIPSGGSSGQVLTKTSGTDYDAEWADVNAGSSLPEGGTTGQALVKASNADDDTEWATVIGVPAGGTAGQILKKINNDDYAVEWAGDEGRLPSGGTSGQVLKKASGQSYDIYWADESGGGGGSGNNVVVRGTGAASAVVVNGSYPNIASGPAAMAIGGDSVASGGNSFAGGQKSAQADFPTTASGEQSFAFGLSAKATGNRSVAFGQRTIAAGQYSFAAGVQSEANGNSSVAMGQLCGTNAVMSQAFGNGTQATGRAAMAIGQYNVADDNAVDTSHGSGARKYLFTVGNGTADDARSNAMTVDWDGNVVAAGKLTVGAAPTADMDVATKKYVDDNSGGGGGGTTEIYWATYGTTTSAQIEAAYQAGKIVCCDYDGRTYVMSMRESATKHRLASALQSGVNTLVCNSDTWSTSNRSIPTAYTSTPADLGTASAGSATTWARGDHVHAMPSAADVGAAPEITEVTVATDGAVTQALDVGKLYHFTGALTALTITLTAASAGQIAQYHFDFDSGSTAPTLTLPNTVTMPSGFTVEANKHYEIDILNGYGVVASWATS